MQHSARASQLCKHEEGAFLQARAHAWHAHTMEATNMQLQPTLEA